MKTSNLFIKIPIKNCYKEQLGNKRKVKKKLEKKSFDFWGLGGDLQIRDRTGTHITANCYGKKKKKMMNDIAAIDNIHMLHSNL